MPNYLDLEPEELREIAKQHERAAAEVRKWGKVPRAWLDDFRRTHGAIAEPMRRALENYYRKRHDKAERQAENHEKTRDTLRDAARVMEEADQNSGSAVAKAGEFVNGRTGPSGTPAPLPPAVPMSVHGYMPPAATGPAQSVASTGRTVSAGAGSVAPGRTGVQSGPVLGQPAPPASPVAWAPPVNESVPDRAVAPTGVTPTAGPFPVGAAAAPTSSDARPTAALASAAPGTLSSTGNEPAAGGPGRSLPTWLPQGQLAATAHVNGNKAMLPSLVVGEHAEDDLDLARTVLAATLYAVADSAPSVEWATAVVRIRSGPIVVLTSNEGRGWLPSGLFLPDEVCVPWNWGEVFGDVVRRATELSEGAADPARIFAELSPIFRGKRRGITALASSTLIADSIREAVGRDTVIAERVAAARAAVDFATPGTGLTDRLAIGGSERLLHEAAAVPDSEVRSFCLALAHEADARVRAVIPETDAEVSAHRAHRQHVLRTLDAPGAILSSQVDEMCATDARAAAAQQSRRVDVSHISVGDRPDSHRIDALRARAFERRADELLQLLAPGEPSRQTLRDMLYAYGQIVEHPLFPTTAVHTPKLADAAIPTVPTTSSDDNGEDAPSAVGSWSEPVRNTVYYDGVPGKVANR